MSDDVILTEPSRDRFGDEYTVAWHCEPPERGVAFRVLQQEWTDDYTVRHIREIELLDA